MTLTPMTFRIETSDAKDVEEYRLIDGCIQPRELQADRSSGEWRILTPAELTAHVEKKTIVARWLQQRLGWRVLLRACVADQQYLHGEAATEKPHAA